MATHPDAKIRYHASDMILNVHSDASYLSVPNARSRAAGIFFLAKQAKQFLDYTATHPDAEIRYHASDMILNVHSDASYLSVPNARSRAAGIFFLGSLPQPNKPIFLNGAIYVLCTILRFVAASTA
eukprot:CCRYP_013741-RA/>CCRYP_013741-RA protein AED:0.45 eAED:0.45 QI:0/0/0/1/0/0/2/0/125